MQNNFISNDLLIQLFQKIEYTPKPQGFNKVREIINNDLQSGSPYPNDCATEIIEYLDLDVNCSLDIIEVLKPIYIRDNSDYDFYPDNY